MMLNKSGKALVSSLKQMTKYCRDIQELLDADKAHFSKNALSNISDSNNSKAIILEKLTALINEINANSEHNQSGNFLDSIEKNADGYDRPTKSEITSAINELKSEIAIAYQSLATNSKIIFSNIQQLHNIWEKLSVCRSQIECVYDHKGSTGI